MESRFTAYFFLMSVGILQLTEGGHFVLVPTVLAKIYGIDGGMRVFSVGFCFAGFGSLINTLMLSILLEPFSYEGLTLVYSGFNLISLLYLVFLYKFRRIECGDIH